MEDLSTAPEDETVLDDKFVKHKDFFEAQGKSQINGIRSTYTGRKGVRQSLAMDFTGHRQQNNIPDTEDSGQNLAASLKLGKATLRSVKDIGPVRSDNQFGFSKAAQFTDVHLAHQGPNIRVSNQPFGTEDQSHVKQVHEDFESDSGVPSSPDSGTDKVISNFSKFKPTLQPKPAPFILPTKFETRKTSITGRAEINTSRTEHMDDRNYGGSATKFEYMGNRNYEDDPDQTMVVSSLLHTMQVPEEPLEELASMLKFCQPCMRQSKYQIATHFCENCGDRGAHVCWNCANQHKKFMELCTHRIQSVMINKCCEDEPSKLHRRSQCPSFCSYQAIQDLIDSYEKEKASLKRCRSKRETDQKKLYNDKNKIEAKIQEIRQKLNEQLDMLEASAMHELHVRYRKAQQKIQQDLKALEETIQYWENILRDLGIEDIGDNKSVSFRTINEEKERLTVQSEKLMAKVNLNIGTEKLEFVTDIKLLDYELDLRGFGTFVDSAVEKFHASFQGEYQVATVNDDEECDITACCVLSDGTVLLADSSNAKLKKLDNAYNIVAAVDLPEKPYHMCATGDSEVALSIPKDKILQIVDTTGDLKLRETLPMSRSCACVEYNNGLLYVTYDWPKQICVYKRNGQWVRTYREYTPVVDTNTPSVKDPKTAEAKHSKPEKENKGSKLFSSLKKKKQKPAEKEELFESLEEILVSETGDTIYACDDAKGLVMVSRNGENVTTIRNFKQMPLFAAKRICRGCAEDFFLYGLSEKSNKHALMHIDRGKGVQMMEGDEEFREDIQDIESMCYDKTTSRLIITSNSNNGIRVYEIT